MITELDLLMRALSSRTRLRILGILWQARAEDWVHRGARPAQIGRLLGISPEVASHHLRILLRLHLVRYWKKGLHKFYRYPRLRKDSLRYRILERIREDLPAGLPAVFKEGYHPLDKGYRPRHRPLRHGEKITPVLDGLWADLTCFSHFRRLIMFEFMLKRGSATRGELSDAADIHVLTVDYHLDKLVRRGAIAESGGRYHILSPAPHPIRRLLLSTLSAPVYRGGREEPGA